MNITSMVESKQGECGHFGCSLVAVHQVVWLWREVCNHRNPSGSLPETLWKRLDGREWLMDLWLLVVILYSAESAERIYWTLSVKGLY